MTSFYILVLLVLGLVWYGGYDGTMRLFAYIDLNTRYWFLLRKLYRMKCKMEKELGMPTTDFQTFKESIEK